MATVNIDASFYPYVSRQPVAPEAWAAIKAGVGNWMGAGVVGGWRCATAPSANLYSYLWRSIIVFDTSELSGRQIFSASLVLVLDGGIDDQHDFPTFNIFTATPANPAVIVATDYGNCGATPFSDEIQPTLPTLIEDPAGAASGVYQFPLNALGLNHINKTGYTSFSLRESTYDAGVGTPTWADDSRGVAWFHARIPLLAVSCSDAASADRTLQEPIVLLQAMRQVEMQFGGQLSISKEGTFTYRSRQSYYEGV